MSLCLSVCLSHSQGILVNRFIDPPILFSIDSCLFYSITIIFFLLIIPLFVFLFILMYSIFCFRPIRETGMRKISDCYIAQLRLVPAAYNSVNKKKKGNKVSTLCVWSLSTSHSLLFFMPTAILADASYFSHVLKIHACFERIIFGFS